MSIRPEEDDAARFGSTVSRIAGIAVALLALTIIAAGGLIRPDRIGDFFSATSAGLMPTMVLLALAACGTALAIRPDAIYMERFSLRYAGVKLLALLYLFLYSWAVAAWGWLPASLALLVTMPLLAGYRGPVGIAISAVLVLGGVWLIFVVGIGAPLP